jgi:RNA polymerase primary sigma factor
MPLLRRCRDESPLGIYLRDIHETPLLNADEERNLVYRIEDGDSEARDHLVRANLRLVVNIARGYGGRADGLGLQDLIEEGNLGLLRAAEAFDPSMGTRFATYAAYWIKQSIKRTIINTAKTIRLPAYMVDLLSKWRRATNCLQNELGRTPTDQEIADRLNLSKKRLSIVKKAIRIYYATSQGDEGDEGRSLAETVAGGKAPETAMFEQDDLQQVLHLLDEMDARYATVLRLRFGLTGEEPMTLEAIGDRLGLTYERIRQIERQGLGRLRKALGAA